MCLDRKPTRDEVIRDFKKKIQVEKGSYFGYKIFQKDKKKLYSSIYFGGPYELNEWIIDKSKATVDYSETDSEYRCGFHVYIDKEEALEVFKHYKKLETGHYSSLYSLRKVYFNKVIAYGYEENAPSPLYIRTIITREMFIPKMR